MILLKKKYNDENRKIARKLCGLFNTAQVVFLLSFFFLSIDIAAAQRGNQSKAEQALYKKGLGYYEDALKKENSQERIKCLQKAVSFVPASSAFHYALGREFYQISSLDSAVIHFERVIILDRRLADETGLIAILPHAYSALTTQAIERGDLKSALNSALNSLRHDSAFVPALSASALIYYQIGQYGQASEIGLRIVKQEPTAENYNNLGAACEANGNYDDAISYYRQALFLNPGLDEAGLNLNRVRNHISAKNSKLVKISQVSTGSETLDKAPVQAEIPNVQPQPRVTKKYPKTHFEIGPPRKLSQGSLITTLAVIPEVPIPAFLQMNQKPNGFASSLLWNMFIVLALVTVLFCSYHFRFKLTDWGVVHLNRISEKNHLLIQNIQGKNTSLIKKAETLLRIDSALFVPQRLSTANGHQITNHEMKLLPEPRLRVADKAKRKPTKKISQNNLTGNQKKRKKTQTSVNGVTSPKLPSEKENGIQVEKFFTEMVALEPLSFKEEDGLQKQVTVKKPQEKKSIQKNGKHLINKNSHISFVEEGGLQKQITVKKPQEKKNIQKYGKKLINKNSHISPTATRTIEMTALDAYKIDRFVIEKEISKGGNGKIYKAWDPKLDRAVVLKTVEYSFAASEFEIPAFKERIYVEARAIAKLKHPNIVTIYDVDDEPDFSYLVMEYLDGSDLRRLLRQEHRLDCKQAIDIVVQICDALEYAHHTGVYHRDIKPSNVMLLENGDVKVMDFGIAKINNSFTLTQPGKVLGTPCYMAPEQIDGQDVDGRADLFSLGVVLYELLIGKRPFVADSLAALAYKIVHKTHIPPSLENVELPMDIDNILNKALAKKPEDRYKNAKVFRDALTELHSQTESASLSAVKI